MKEIGSLKGVTESLVQGLMLHIMEKHALTDANFEFFLPGIQSHLNMHSYDMLSSTGTAIILVGSYI
jgi:hypothetical protein